ncbi:MAG: hypothetical protein ABI426_07475 [Flavobacterium sp.]
MKKILKYSLIALISLFILLFGFLYTYKYLSTKDISEDADNVNIKIYKHKNRTFKYGMKGEYAFFKMSVNGNDWKSIQIAGFLTSIIPSGLNFYSMNSINNTIWVECLHSCQESDCETYLYDYYYSHDNGNSWYSLNKQVKKTICSGLSFKNDNDGTCYYEKNNKLMYLLTDDGGMTWNEKK